MQKKNSLTHIAITGYTSLKSGRMYELFAVIFNLFKLLVAALCGSLIGLRRQSLEPGMVMAIHAMLATASCLFMTLSYGDLLGDPFQTAAALAVGVGCIGAGVIIAYRGAADGIWTAVSLWVAAITGLAVGAELFLEGGAIALLTYFAIPLSHRKSMDTNV